MTTPLLAATSAAPHGASTTKTPPRREDVQQLLVQGAQPPTMQVIAHNAPSEEKFTRNGIVRTVHVVVKNTPFALNLSITNNQLLNHLVDFNSFTCDVRLVYDTDSGVEKEVDFVKAKPVDFKATVGDKGDTASIELRMKVLTSQHEDMFFRAKIVALDPKTGKEFTPTILCRSEPIKVISKPEQIKKATKSSKKRTLTDMLVETVNRIEKQQQEQQRLIEKLLDNGKGNTAPPTPFFPPPVAAAHTTTAADHTSPSDPSATLAIYDWESPKSEAVSTTSPSHPEQLEPTTAGGVDFEGSFVSFLNVYNSLSSEEKPEKVRKIIRTCSIRDTERLSELIDLFTAEGLQQNIGNDVSRSYSSSTHGNAGSSTGDSCGCASCPHKQELLRIDDFYKEFLSQPMFPNGADLNGSLGL